MRRRQLLTNLAVTTAAAARAAIGGSAVGGSENKPGDLLIGRVHDAMLGLSPAPAEGSITLLQAELAAALTDFSMCRYRRLAEDLMIAQVSGTALSSRLLREYLPGWRLHKVWLEHTL